MKNGEGLSDKLVLALAFNEDVDDAPFVSAKGSHEIGSIIIATAKKYNIPIVYRPELRPTLTNLNVESNIPITLYEAVIDILNEIDKVN
jgi:flagellar biosynthesis protein